MTPSRILIIDDQYATEAYQLGDLCSNCGLVKIDVTTSDDDLERLAESEEAMAGAVFSSGQDRRGALVENSIEAVLKIVKSGWPSTDGWRWALILLDLRFDSTPARDEDHLFGLKVLEELVRSWPDREAQTGNSEIPIVMLSTVPREDGARPASRAGASAYVEKEELTRERLQKLLAEHGLISDPTSSGLEGRSYALLRVLREARRVARMRSGNAMILGPQGAGKSSLARYIHEQSGREGAFVPFFSKPSAEQLEYLTLFGYWIGAHSEAKESACGKVEEAHGGTLLIDEVHNLKSNSQNELLEFARPENGRRLFRRSGNFPTSPDSVVAQAKRSLRGVRDTETSRIEVDVLLLSATSEPLDDPHWRLKNGFIEPLYTRLAVEDAGRPLRLPSLADRPEDIPILFKRFLEQETKDIGGRTNADETKSLDAEINSRLKEYSWPGNVAEMKGVAKAVARNSRDFPDVFVRHLPTFHLPLLDVPKEDSAAPIPGKVLPVNSANSLADAEQALRNVQVPRAASELKGRLSSLEDAYGQLIREVLEVAFEETRLTRGGGDFITPTINNLFGSKIDTTTVYSKIIKLARLFEDDFPPEPGSALDYAIKKARGSRDPHGSKKKKVSSNE